MRLTPPSAAQVGAGALVIAALATGRLVSEIAPDTDLASRPIERHAVVGTTAHLRWADLTVTKVTGSRRTSEIGDDLSIGSPGVWLLVTLRMTTKLDAQSPAHAGIQAGDGTEITLGSRNRKLCDQANPGIAVRCAVAFEVPPKALPGSKLVIARDEQQGNLYDDEAVFDLGISKADAAAWAKNDSVIPFPLGQDK
ncbi:MAG: hypothetical protein JWO46_1705 [Nocardioidaceae bacterium]|nr:hypothetical protein [Nocardioidaceae bacterium]